MPPHLNPAGSSPGSPRNLPSRSRPSLQAVVNGTGVVVHTNLGRSPLADEAEEAIHTVSAGYSNLEFDLETGERGTRYAHVEGLICELTGAEAALVVNNNAAAVILALSSLAQGREVIVSRGELVEIGGSFRIPDVMRQSGARLVEVGTTNRTHLRDFLAAITDATALLLKIHTSNFAIVGFTADASVAEMSALGRETGMPVMLDAGSGCLIDLSPYGISGEPTIRQYLDAGADVVTFSGDKLLGGPQAGLIAGRRRFIEPMKRHPLLRALRMDKLNLASLEATLRLYRDERQALAAIPTLRMLTMTAEELARRADMIARRLRRTLPDDGHPGQAPGRIKCRRRFVSPAAAADDADRGQDRRVLRRSRSKPHCVGHRPRWSAASTVTVSCWMPGQSWTGTCLPWLNP